MPWPAANSNVKSASRVLAGVIVVMVLGSHMGDGDESAVNILLARLAAKPVPTVV
jgi:hypothetical protein